ncbi:hypothetical protein BCON_0156g00020 [Botryotinia convoluta]|uniref:Uncharacterized protein n=1 Tax=Botryotinia convoluta TaxID=54673 RepID=A0A4Z1HRN1_9HELO|nr:hypothetical protein BCON_0156g00020 [Botryotinia convoluta]
MDSQLREDGQATGDSQGNGNGIGSLEVEFSVWQWRYAARRTCEDRKVQLHELRTNIRESGTFDET